MTIKQYNTFKAAIEQKGFKLWNHSRTFHNEHFYYYKGFAYPEEEDAQPGYQIIFLIWDFRRYNQLAYYGIGVSPLILISDNEGNRIHLEIQFFSNDFSVDSIERYAHDFYHDFVLTHPL